MESMQPLSRDSSSAKDTEDTPDLVSITNISQESDTYGNGAPGPSNNGVPASSPANDPNLQSGVAEVEAVTSIWTQRDLIIAYSMIWLIYFVDTLQQSTTSNLLVWVTSDFSAHSLTATTTVLSSLFGGLSKLTLAKVLDIWGRPQGYALCILVLTIGLVLMAFCNGVELYCAGQIFYWVGYNGLTYTLNVFIADTSALKNRSLMFAFSTSPYLITTWIGGYIATAFLNGPGWRWAYGAFAIITPTATLPLFFVFWQNREKAKRAGLIQERSGERTRWQSFKYYLKQFDMVGLLLITCGLGLFLLPFNLYSRQEHGWNTPWIIAMLVVGCILLVLFGVAETYFAKIKFLPYELFTDRTISGAFVLAVILFLQFYVWDSYFSSFLQIVMDLDIVHTGYVGNIYTIGSCLWSIVTGIIIRRTGRFKPLALWFGIPFMILGIALMIKFRQPGSSLGLICLCQVLIAFAGGTLIITKELAVMSAVPHQYIAVVLAMVGMFTSVGGAIGSTVSAAIWQNVFPQKLAQYLPVESKDRLAEIVGSISVQKSYDVGTPTRVAINHAYGDAQRVMLITSSVISVGAAIAVGMWRDVNVKEMSQVKGTVV